MGSGVTALFLYFSTFVLCDPQVEPCKTEPGGEQLLRLRLKRGTDREQLAVNVAEKSYISQFEDTDIPVFKQVTFEYEQRCSSTPWKIQHAQDCSTNNVDTLIMIYLSRRGGGKRVQRYIPMLLPLTS